MLRVVVVLCCVVFCCLVSYCVVSCCVACKRVRVRVCLGECAYVRHTCVRVLVCARVCKWLLTHTTPSTRACTHTHAGVHQIVDAAGVVLCECHQPRTRCRRMLRRMTCWRYTLCTGQPQHSRTQQLQRGSMAKRSPPGPANVFMQSQPR